MLTLSKLLNAVEYFYKLAWHGDLSSWAQATVEDKTNVLVELANKVSNPQLSTDLKMLSREYASSVRSGGRQNSVANAIYAIIDDEYLSEATEENKEVKRVLLDTIANLRTRAGGHLAVDETRRPEAAELEVPIEGPESYKELIALINKISNTTLNRELTLIAKLYLKSIELGGGYNTIFNGIKTFMNSGLDIDRDDPLVEAIQDVLSSIQADLIKLAGGAKAINTPDDPSIVQQLRRTHQEIAGAYQERAGSAIEEGMEYEHLQKERPDTGVEISDEDKPEDKLDQSDIGQVEKGCKTGFLFRKNYQPKDWIRVWQNENEIYRAALEAPSTPLIKKKYQDLIKTNNELIATIPKLTELEKQVLLEVESPDPKKIEALEAIKHYMSELKKARLALRKPIREFNLIEAAESLSKNVDKTIDQYAKEKLEQQIALNKSLVSRDYGREKENNLRRTLISQLEYVPKEANAFLFWQNRIKALKEKIAEAVAGKRSILDVRVDEAKAIKEKKESGSLAGLNILLGQQIASRKNDIKKAIKKPIKTLLLSEEDTTFSLLKTNLSAAILAKNLAEVTRITKELNAAVDARTNELVESDAKIVAFVKVASIFYDFRDQSNQLDKTGILDEKPLPDSIKPTVEALSDAGITIVKKYSGVGGLGTLVGSIASIITILKRALNE